MGFNVDVQRDKNKEFLKSIEAWEFDFHFSMVLHILIRN